MGRLTRISVTLFSLIVLFTFYALHMHTSASAQAVPPMIDNKYNLSTEDQLTKDYSLIINEFWEMHSKITKFESIHGGTIHTVQIKTGQNKAAVISQGRSESILKYKELAYDLYNQGYDIFLIDHRGQGFSSRLGGDEHRGHVQSFEHYVSDFTTFVDQLNLTEHYQTRVLLSHSMGGTISALYLQQQQHPFQAAAFFSPMLSINLSGLPILIAKIITYITDLVCSWFSELACYVPGGEGYSPGSFSNNPLTHSEKRYASGLGTFDYERSTQLGGPTMRWVNESLYATEKAIDNASLVTIPFILLRSGDDDIVTPTGQNMFYKNRSPCPASQFLKIEGARHELLLEADQYRLPALNATLDFFKRIEKGELSCTT